ncbi:MAG: FAD-binding oxidoreductase [Acidimicrobiia bacterium]|nr:FAD-binding oxidoreductase [Acidimicrobiia bacterium]
MPTRSGVIIIGAGIIGCSTALELARRGHVVTVVDKLPAAGYGSTSSSSGIIRFHYSTAAGVALAWEGLHYWRDWAAHVRAAAPEAVAHEALIEIVEVPMFMLLDTSEPTPPFLTHFDAIGIPYEILDHAEVDRWPTAIDTRKFGPPARLDDLDDPFWGEPSTHFDQIMVMGNTGYVPDPQLAAQNLYTAALAEGVTFLFKREVVAITRDDSGGRVSGVTLADGEPLEAPIVVNIAGPHSAKVNAMAGVEGEMVRSGRALRREVYLGPAPDGYDNDNGFLGGDFDVGVYYRPERGGNIMIGSVEPECDELEWVDPDSFDETVDEDEFQQAMMRASRRLPDLAIPHSKRGLVSLYDATEDWTPIYDRSSLDGFYMACGTSGNQFKNAGVVGHLMAELITAVEGGHDHDAKPVVVIGHYTGLAIDTGTFSRLRPVDSAAAKTVFG